MPVERLDMSEQNDIQRQDVTVIASFRMELQMPFGRVVCSHSLDRNIVC